MIRVVSLAALHRVQVEDHALGRVPSEEPHDGPVGRVPRVDMPPDVSGQCHEIVMLDQVLLQLQAVAFLQQVVILDGPWPRVEVQVVTRAHGHARVLD